MSIIIRGNIATPLAHPNSALLRPIVCFPVNQPVSEDFWLKSAISRVAVKDGKIEVEFSRDGRSKTIALTPTANEDLGVVFIKGVGVETVESAP